MIEAILKTKCEEEPNAGEEHDRRSNERHRVIFRTAKLLLGGHDSFCIVRDVSSRGLKLQMFGPLDDIELVAIEFLGGRKLRMHRRWTRGEHCGFEFESPIDIAAVIALPPRNFDRRPQRLDVDAPAAVDVAGEIMSVRLCDISLAGAKIAVDTKLKVWSEIRIGIDGLGRKKARICWYKDGRAGLHFLTPIAFNELAAWSAMLPPVTD